MQDNERAFADDLESIGFTPGPALVESLDDIYAVRVTFDVNASGKADALLNWLTYLTKVNATAGRFHASDDEVRFNLRGLSPKGVAFIVSVPYSARRESQSVAVIDAEIERQAPGDILGMLSILEMAGKT